MQKGRKLLRKGQVVLDLGCWPGGWLQVAGKLVGREGCVVGVDLQELTPTLEMPNVRSIVGDFTDDLVIRSVMDALGRKAEVVLSDAAPKTTGIKATDRAREETLLQSVVSTLPNVLDKGGDLLMKLLDCPEAQHISNDLRTSFDRTTGIGLKATRKGSKERYFLARGYRG
ncbi:RlmE family RNA methyltransferase [Myxococcota bacterium]|nr:RlmE family RNA methyltransferase [Myxococcota bacterium]